MEILLIFKTHLDLGYTDMAEAVERRYIEEFIPGALDLAEKTAGTDCPFVWTTGSFLIERFLQSSTENAARMEHAIRMGLISWHALPFTMHAEMMDAPLYEYGLSWAKRLDARFGVKTVAAKSTDVPGMTRAVVPLLQRAGVSLLHIGVNPFSAVPDVPEIFRWAAPDGSSVRVIYNRAYGEATALPGTDKMLWFAMTNDNLGPQAPDDIAKVYEEVRAKYPGAVVRAATLNDAANALEKANPDLPVFTGEIGDSWAHGYQADPRKQTVYRGLLRYARSLPESERNKLYSGLLLTAEHTCGLNGVNTLCDNGDYLPAEFDSCRGKPGFQRAEASWREQRAYAENAVRLLVEPYRDEALRIISEADKAAPDMSGEEIKLCRDMYTGQEVTIGRFTLTVGFDGAVYGVALDGKERLSAHTRLFGFGYELFSPAETLKFCEQYGRDRLSWGYDDFSKRGLEKAGVPKMTCGAVLTKLVKTDADKLIAVMMVPDYFTEFGCPKKLYLEITAEGDQLAFDFFWTEKRANRIPECLFLDIDNPGKGMAIRKLGEWIDPRETVSRGGRALHGTDYGFRLGECEILMQDSALVSFGADIWNFDNRVPRDDDGARIILYNNQWNTNFPFWYGEAACFRFKLSFLA